MDVVRRCLKPEGLFLLHTLGSDGGGSGADPWLTKYIFPNGILPSTTSLMRAAQGRFIMEDWQNFGAFLRPTLLVWHKNFRKGVAWKASSGVTNVCGAGTNTIC